MLSGELPRVRREVKQIRGPMNAKPHIAVVDRGKAATLLNCGEIPRILDKVSKNIVDWCVRMEVGTIFTGAATARKQLAHINTRSGASFNASVYNILSASLLEKIRKKAAAAGIQFVMVDESYTSRASFADGDAIPASNANTAAVSFSGRRVKRDTYRTAGGAYIHADLNASANIARKAFPEAFAGEHTPPNFGSVVVITDPFAQEI